MFSVSSFVVLLALGSAFAIPAAKNAGINFGRFGVIAPIADPLFAEDIEVSLAGFPHFGGGFSVCSATVTGMSTLVDNISILPGGVLAIKVEIELDLGHVEVNGVYTSDATLRASEVVPELPDYHLKGQGALVANATNGRIKVSATLPYVGNANIRELTADVSFDNANANLEGALLNEELMDWDLFNANIKEIFDNRWAESGPEITEAVRNAVNTIIETCTVAELIDIIAGNGTTECLTLPPTLTNLGSIVQNSGRIACRTIGYVCPAPEGNFEDPKDCASFFSCTNGVPEGHHHCPDDLLFNPNIGNCDFPWNVDCPGAATPAPQLLKK